MPSPSTQQIRDLKQQVVGLIAELKARDEREKELVKRLAALQRALGRIGK